MPGAEDAWRQAAEFIGDPCAPEAIRVRARLGGLRRKPGQPPGPESSGESHAGPRLSGALD